MKLSRYIGREQSVLTGNKKVGVLLTNLGTPAAPTAQALKVYLKQFLSDPRVVEIPRLVWFVILYGIILRVRPKKSAKLYDSIWTENGSPLLVISEQTRDKVARQLRSELGEDVIVEIGMRYGEPAIGKQLARFQEQGVEEIVVLPLYPQFAGPTTASTFDAVTDEVKRWRWIPSLHFVSGYHENDDYIDALANSISEDFSANGKPKKLVLSYHGMPKLFLDNGDPYYYFCQKTTELVIEKLGLTPDEYIKTFQSRFGNAKWLKPYTDETLASLGEQGVDDVAIISPAFSADCLETLEELVHENKEVFLEAGGKSYRYIPALNDREDHCNAIVNIIKKQLGA